MSHLRDAASWYWPGRTHCYGMFTPRGARPSKVEASPAEAAALSTPWVAALTTHRRPNQREGRGIGRDGDGNQPSADDDAYQGCSGKG